MRPAVVLAALALLGGCASPATQATSDSVTSSAAATTAVATTSAPTRVTSPPAPRAAHTATHRPTATRTAAPTHRATPTHTAPSPARVVHPGAYCAPEGATGRTAKGTAMRCTLKAGETRARWRRA